MSLRPVLSLVVCATCLIVAVGASAQDSAVVLARILAEKGIITKSDLARVESAGGDKSQVLTQVAASALTQKEKPPAAVAASSAASSPAEKTANGPITFYGSILWNSYLNTSLTNNADVPLFAGKQGSDAAGNDKNFGMTVRQSRLGLRFNGPEVAGAKSSAVVETDFFGGQASLANGIAMDLVRLRLAYGRLDWTSASLVAGQDWSVFAPLNPTSLASFAIPAMAASGNPWSRTPQVRGEWRDKSLLWQMAATDPNIGDYPAAFATSRTPAIGERGRLPAFDSRLAWTHRMNGQQASLGVSSHYSRGKNAGAIGTRNVEQGVDSWGVALDYIVPLHRRLILSGEIFEGRALGAFSVGLGQGVLAVGTPGAHGVGAAGGWSQAQIQLSPRWQWNTSYGLESDEAANLTAGARNRNSTLMTNLMYKLSPQFTVAGEYRRLFTDFYNQQPFNERGDHFNLAVGYIF